MTRAEAAAQAAWAIAELSIERDPSPKYRRAVEDDLAAALLVLTEPAEPAPLPLPPPFRMACCGEVFSTREAWERHRSDKEGTVVNYHR